MLPQSAMVSTGGSHRLCRRGSTHSALLTAIPPRAYNSIRVMAINQPTGLRLVAASTKKLS